MKVHVKNDDECKLVQKIFFTLEYSWPYNETTVYGIKDLLTINTDLDNINKNGIVILTDNNNDHRIYWDEYNRWDVNNYINIDELLDLIESNGI